MAKYQLSFEPALWRRLKIRCAEDEITVKAGLLRAVEAWLAAPAAGPRGHEDPCVWPGDMGDTLPREEEQPCRAIREAPGSEEDHAPHPARPA